MSGDRPLTKPAHEEFCRNVAMGMKILDAAASAGMHKNYGQILLRKPEVISRIEYLKVQREAEREENEQRELMERSVEQGVGHPSLVTTVKMRIEDFTLEFLVNQFLDIALEAKQVKNFNASTKALQIIAEALGLFNHEGQKTEEQIKKELTEKAKKTNLITLESLNNAFKNAGLNSPVTHVKEKVEVNTVDPVAEAFTNAGFVEKLGVEVKND